MNKEIFNKIQREATEYANAHWNNHYITTWHDLFMNHFYESLIKDILNTLESELPNSTEFTISGIQECIDTIKKKYVQ